jgi:hypothetical protein
MTEQQPYDVVKTYPGFEVRRYPAHLIAEVEVVSSFSEAGNQGFGVLIGYISGRNSARGTIAMTAPVVQAPTKIAMTSPVIQEPGGGTGRHLVAFVMPAEYDVDTLPEPSDPRITIKEVADELAAAATFTGRWTETIYQDQLAALRAAVIEAGLEITGPPRFARFDPPFKPWFLRRNEVVLPVLSVG